MMASPKKRSPGEQPRTIPSVQDKSAPAVVSHPELGMMDKVGEVGGAQRNPLLPLMGAGGPPKGAGHGLMPPVTHEVPAALPDVGKPQEPRQNHALSHASEGYVRIRLRVQGEALSVIGIKEVPGPLLLPTAIIRGHVYEVLLGEQLVALESVPDVGVRRSFANRDVPGPEGKHHFARLSNVEFMARIPRMYISAANLPKLTIKLHLISDAPDRMLTLTPLSKRTDVQSKQVAHLDGIQLDAMPPPLRAQFEAILNDAK